MTAMTQSISTLFDTAIERYKAGEGPDTLLPVFKEICDRSPKTGSAWTCLSWLYLLSEQPNLAYKAAQKAVKLNPSDPQSRLNLATAMLETKQSGVREHVDIVRQMLVLDPELRAEILQSIDDGLSRKPDWPSLDRIKSWLFS
jgi:predicted Zn-dependent protease